MQYCLKGDLNQMRAQSQYIVEQCSDITSNFVSFGIPPYFTKKKDYDVFVSCAWIDQPDGWWNYKKEFIHHGFCTLDEFQAELTTYIDRKKGTQESVERTQQLRKKLPTVEVSGAREESSTMVYTVAVIDNGFLVASYTRSDKVVAMELAQSLRATRFDINNDTGYVVVEEGELDSDQVQQRILQLNLDESPEIELTTV